MELPDPSGRRGWWVGLCVCVCVCIEAPSGREHVKCGVGSSELSRWTRRGVTYACAVDRHHELRTLVYRGLLLLPCKPVCYKCTVVAPKLPSQLFRLGVVPPVSGGRSWGVQSCRG